RQSTLTDLLYGAIGCAIRAQYPAAAGPLPLVVGVPVDLRRRLDPPVAPDDQLCCVGRCVVRVDVHADARPLAIGHRLGAAGRVALDRSVPQRRLLAERLDPSGPPPATSVIVSNIGVLDAPALPPGLRVAERRLGSARFGPVPALYASTVSGTLAL